MNGRRRPKSILTTEPGTCYLCQKQGVTNAHHILHGSGYRKIADKLGLIVYLCPECHTGTDGIHGKNGHERDMDLKKIAQYTYEQQHSHEEWMKKVGRNFL